MAKRNRFYFRRYYQDLPEGWGLYSDREIEEKAHAMPFIDASRYYQKQFESGNEQAIYEFVKYSPECFREVWPLPEGDFMPCYSNNILKRPGGRSWVVEQIEKWKVEGTPEARKKLKKLFSAYADNRGAKEKPPENDWKIYQQVKKRLGKKGGASRGGITKAIWKVVESNNRIEEELSRELQKKLLDLLTTAKGPQRRQSLVSIAQETGIQYRKLAAYITNGKTRFNTYREIYYKLRQIEQQYIEDEATTVDNLRLQFFLPHKGVAIPNEYEERFRRELSLYCSVEWLRKGFISFPSIRGGLGVYTGVRPFEEERLPLKEALERVSQDKEVPIDELKVIYSNLIRLEAMYFHDDRTEVLKEL